jgi:hypothetical protein
MFEIQNMLVYLIVLLAVFFLVKKFFLKKKKQNKAGCGSECGCHKKTQ